MKICEFFAEYRAQLSHRGERYVLTIIEPYGADRMAFDFKTLEEALDEAHAWMAFFVDDTEFTHTAGEVELLTSDAFMQEALMRFVTNHHDQEPETALRAWQRAGYLLTP